MSEEDWVRSGDPDWQSVSQELDAYGCAVLPGLLPAEACLEISQSYGGSGFRSHVHMARHGFGRGEYKYFSYPLPKRIEALRTRLYPPLARIANEWQSRIALPLIQDSTAPYSDHFPPDHFPPDHFPPDHFPSDHRDYLARCHAAGQVRPTPLLLQYGPGDFNCLHQDLYGQHVFPLQVVVLLSRPGSDFTGGHLVLTEQRPRHQSRVEVVSLSQGDGVVFAVNRRPVSGARGSICVNMRHGVSRILTGHRHTLGIIFHDAA